MFRREAEGLRRQAPDRQLGGKAGEHPIQHHIGEQDIGGQRQLGAVLLNSSERPDHGGTGAFELLRHIGPVQVFQGPLRRWHGSSRGLHSPTLPVRLVD